MDFRSLQLFQHLSTSLHFGETANAMFVSPSTLSRIIQRLEDECGSPLFVRDNRKVALTQAGETLATFAQRVLNDWDDVHQQLIQDHHEVQGELSLYCSVTASQSHLPNLLRHLAAKYPKVTLKLHTGDPALSLQKVLDKQSDVALAIRPPYLDNHLYFTQLDRVPLTLIVPKQWRVTSVEALDWENHPVVLPETGYARDIVENWFKARNVKPQVYASVGGNEAIVAMVALGCGFGVVPQIVLDHSSTASQVQHIPVSDIEPYELGLSCLANRKDNPLIKALLNVATELSY